MPLPRKENRTLILIAFVLAVTTYLYLSDVIRRTEEEPKDPSYKLIKLTAASVPVKVRFASNPPEGFRLISEEVTVNPSRLVVIGPEALLEETSSAETAILDLGHRTKRFVKSIPIESVSGIHLSGEAHTVEVVIPIEKLEPNS